jgi:hypothetical protein
VLALPILCRHERLRRLQSIVRIAGLCLAAQEFRDLVVGCRARER